MNAGFRTAWRRDAAIAVLVLLGLGGLSACAAPGESIDPEIAEALNPATLTQSKSPVQLLRNEAAGRLPRIVMQGVVENDDSSVSCLSEEADPSGLARSWLSSTTILITNSRAASIHEAVTGVASTFVAEGWEAAATSSEGSSTHVLSSASTYATIAVEAVGKTGEREALIHISVTGPCVLTAGPESDEVMSLERHS